MSVTTHRPSLNPQHVGDPGGFRVLPMIPGSWEAQAFGISADGNVVVGAIRLDEHSGYGYPCYWADTYAPPIILSMDAYGYGAFAASYDGSTIAGNASGARPFTWTRTGGFNIFDAPGAEMTCMTPDTKFLAGSFNTRLDGTGQQQACYWDEHRHRTMIGFLPGHNMSNALAISGDGKYVVGWSDVRLPGVFNYDMRGFRWSAETGMIDLGIVPPGLESRGFGVSDDGNLVGGDQVVGGNGAFGWTPLRGMFIPPLLVPNGNSTVTCVSGDGTTMGGYANIPYPGPGGIHYAYWTNGGTNLNIPNPVQMDPEDPDLGDNSNQTYPTAISRDGRTAVGYTFGRQTLPWIFIAGRCLPPEPINAAEAPIAPATITPWTIEPDWADGVTERLMWKTDVITSQTGIEQRRRLRNAPRRQLEAAFTLIGQDRRFFDNLMVSREPGMWNVPLWWEKYRTIGAASAGDIAVYVEDMTYSEVTSGDVVMLRGTSPFTFETAEVLAVSTNLIEVNFPLTRDWPVGTLVYLTKLCRITGEQTSSRRADNAAQITLTFDTIEPNDYTGVAPPDLGLDFPVLETIPNEAEDLTTRYNRLVQEFDNQSVSVPVRRDLAGVPFMLQQFSFFTNGRKELADLRGLLYYLEGRLVPLYVPTYFRDVELMSYAFAEPGETTIVVSRSGYADYVGTDLRSRRLLMFVFRDGTILLHTVVAANVISDGVESLTVGEPFYRQISPTYISRICWLALSRQDQDEVEILHHADGRGPTTMTTTFATLREGRIETSYTTDVWNGSYVQDATEPVPSPPDGPVEETVVDQVPLQAGDVGGVGGESGEGGDGGAEGGSEGGI